MDVVEFSRHFYYQLGVHFRKLQKCERPHYFCNHPVISNAHKCLLWDNHSVTFLTISHVMKESIWTLINTKQIFAVQLKLQNSKYILRRSKVKKIWRFLACLLFILFKVLSGSPITIWLGKQQYFSKATWKRIENTNNLFIKQNILFILECSNSLFPNFSGKHQINFLLTHTEKRAIMCVPEGNKTGNEREDFSMKIRREKTSWLIWGVHFSFA